MGTVETETEASGTVVSTGASGDTGRWLTPDEQDTWRAYLATSKLLFRQLDRDLQPFGLSGNDYEILVVLSEAPEHRLRMTDLADATAQSRSRLSHQITRMEAAGLVRRESCPGDKRGLFAVLTETGMATIERVAPFHVDSVRRHFIDQMCPEHLEVLSEAYEPVLNRLRKVRDRD